MGGQKGNPRIDHLFLDNLVFFENLSRPVDDFLDEVGNDPLAPVGQDPVGPDHLLQRDTGGSRARERFSQGAR